MGFGFVGISLREKYSLCAFNKIKETQHVVTSASKLNSNKHCSIRLQASVHRLFSDCTFGHKRVEIIFSK